jgi:DNA polymerase (family X)
MDPAGIAASLREIATYLELEGDRFRGGAYARAARSIEASRDLDRLIAEDRVTELSGVGASLAKVVADLAAARPVAVLDRLRARWPAVIVELSRLPGVSAAKARTLFEALAPRDLDELAAMCDAGQVRALSGFGAVTEARIRDAIRGRHARGASVLNDAARELGESLAVHLRAIPEVAEVVVCGPARRWVEMVDTLALAVATTAAPAVRDRLRRHPLVVSMSDDDGPELAVARLASGLRCELHTAPPDRLGAAIVVATGSADHVAALRQLGELTGRDEAAVYRGLGLPWLPPEVRDGTDELAAARAGDDFRDLVAHGDIAGAIHCHTVYSDGKHTVEEMARAAEARGLSYITITDHSPTAHYAGGLTVDRLRAQWAEIADVQRRVGITILRGTESDILRDGGLDYPDDVLGSLDVVIASIHNRYKLDEDQMTRRLVAAMRHPAFKIWGHAMGRMMPNRPAIDCRFDEVLDAIASSRAAIEINGDPHRLDLDPERARRARARGVRFVLSTDAHSTRQLSYLDAAVGLARRARIRRAEVLNCLAPDEFARAVRPA